jgi:hypothetical protein
MGDDQPLRQISRQLAHDRFARQAVKPVALDTVRLQFLGDRQDTRNLRQAGVKGGVEAAACESPPKCSWAKRMTVSADGACSGAKAVAASSSRSTASSIRRCFRSLGPPCTIRCPMASCAGILESARSLPMRMIASRWLGMDSAGEARISARILRVEFTSFIADRLSLAGEQQFRL